jgi:hypothetical protein
MEADVALLEVITQAQWMHAFETLHATQERYYAARVTDMDAGSTALLRNDHSRALADYASFVEALDA